MGDRYDQQHSSQGSSGGYDRRSGHDHGGGRDGGRGGPIDQPAVDPVIADRQKIVQFIVRLGDKSSASLEENMKGCAQALHEMMGQHRKLILETLLKCTLALPTKTPIYATLVGLASLDDSNFAADILNNTKYELHVALRRREFYSIKLLLRFVAELFNARLVASDCVVALLTAIIRQIGPAPDRSLPQHILDFYALLIMTTIPLVGPPIATDPEILSFLEKYMGQRTKVSFSVFEEEAETEQKNTDWLQQLYTAVQAHEAAEWPLIQTVFSPWHHSDLQQLLIQHDHPASVGWFDDLTDQHITALITGQNVSKELQKSDDLADAHFEGETKICHFTSPRSVFSLFPTTLFSEGQATDGAASVKITPLERYYLEEAVQDLLYFFNASRKDLIQQLLNLPFPLRNLEHFLIQNILGELFRLPSSAFPFLYYGVVLIDLVKYLKDSMPPVLAEAVHKLFMKTPEMEGKVLMTFVDWFAYHLSNFDFKWNWASWQAQLEEGAAEPSPEALRKRHFVTEVLQKCIRLSYWERVEKAIPPTFAQNGILPAKPDVVNPFGPTATPEPTQTNPIFSHSITKDLVTKLKARQSVQEVLSKALTSSLSETDDTGLTRVELIQVLTRALMMMGSKSHTHMQVVMDRYKTALHHLAYNPAGVPLAPAAASASASAPSADSMEVDTPSNEQEVQLSDPNESPLKENGLVILQSTWDQFANSTQHWLLACLKMLRARLLSPGQLVQFIFQKAILKSSGHKLFYWELLDQAIRMTIELAKLNVVELHKVEKMLMRREEHQIAITKTKEKLAMCQKDLHELLFNTFNGFVTVLNEYLAGKGDEKELWFRITLGNFKALGRKYYKYLRSSMPDLEKSFEDVDPSLHAILDELKFLNTNF